VRWRGRLVAIRIDQDAAATEVSLVDGEAMPAIVSGLSHVLQPGGTVRVEYRADDAG